MSEPKACSVRRGWAEWYIGRGWVPVPLYPVRDYPGVPDDEFKKPEIDGHTSMRLDGAGGLTHGGAVFGLDRFDGDGNIAVLTGAPSNGLADVDLDDPRGDVQALAPDFLPETMTFGHSLKPWSHWLYRCEPAKRVFWSVPCLDEEGDRVLNAKGKVSDTLLELRSEGGYTMFPGSVHRDGGPVNWSDGLDLGAAVPLDVDRLGLEDRCRRLAVAALLVREGMDRGEATGVALEGAGEALRERLRFEPHRAAVAKWFGLAGALVEAPRAPSRAPELSGSNERPGDWLARNVSWADILTPHEWTASATFNGQESWRRPGSKKRTAERSAYVSSDGGRLFVMTTNGGKLDPGDYDKIGAFARLEGITVGEAARLVRERFGMPAATSWQDQGEAFGSVLAAAFLDGARRNNAGGEAMDAEAPPGAAPAPVVASTKSTAALAFEPPPDLYRHRFSADPDRKPNPRQWLLVDADGNGAIPAGEVGLLIAAGGTGKTMALVQLAATVAGCGMPWLGTATEGTKAKDGWRLCERPDGGEAFGRVLLVMAEEDFDEMDRRRYRFLWAAAGGDRYRYGALAAAFAAHVVPYPLAGVQCALTGSADGKSPEKPSPWSAAFREMLAADAEANGPWRLIILDPATRFMGPDGETDNKAATEWTREVSRLVLDLPGRPSVVVAHHKNKSATKDGAQEQTGARGSSSLTDSARFQLDLARDSDGVLTLALVKGNYSKAAPKLRLLFDEAGYLRPITKAELDRIALDKSTEAAVAKLVKVDTDKKASAAAKARVKEMGLAVDEDEEQAGKGSTGRAAPSKGSKASTKNGGGDDDDHG